MNHEPHIRLIDSHSKSDRSHDHVNFLHKEGILIVGSGLGIKASMVRRSLYSIDIQQFCKFFNLLSAKTIYNAGLSRILSYEFDDILLRIHLVPYFII